MRRLLLHVLLVCSCLGRCAHSADPVRLTTDGHLKRDPVFLNPEGTEIVYTVLEKPTQLRLMKLTCSDLMTTPLHADEARSEFEPAVSASGSHIAFVQSRGNLSLALVIQDRSLKQVGEVPPGGGFSGMHSPAFSPDNSTVFFSYPEEGRQQIYAVTIAGTNRKTIIDSPGVNNWPSVSPNGQTLVFSSTRDDDYEIYVSDVDGTNPRRLTNSPRQDLRPRFSPDGSRIAFTSNRDGNLEIYIMNATGGDVTRITNHLESDDFATWTPDGKSLVMVSERNGRFDLYRVALDR